MSDEPKELYRIIDNACPYTGKASTRTITFTVDKETPCGCWIIQKRNPNGWIQSCDMFSRRWVSRTTHFALPNMHEAMGSYLCRKRRQTIIYTGRLKQAERQLAYADEEFKKLTKEAASNANA